MKTGIAWMRGGVALVGAVAGARGGPGRLAQDRELAQRRRRHLEQQDHPRLQQALSRHQGRVRALAPTEYNAALNARLDGGTAGDLITCRPFDASLELYQKHQLDGLNDLKGMDNFSDVAKAAWSTDDGKTTFCVPMASVIHGFIYNEDAFKKVGATPPKTMAEFHEHSRQAEEGRDLHADRHGHGRPVGGRDDGLPEHRPRLLEGRDRPRWR